MSLLTGLTLLFAGAKVFGFLDWSWWWVFSPALLGIPTCILVAALITVCLGDRR
jgi:ribose/xylose/arabinose/galactoside ABC-type transport system permease subunit